MNNIIPASILIILLLVGSVFGQNIIATTDKGEKVILKSDKTWEYAEKPISKEETIEKTADAFEFAKNNSEKIKKSEFETESQYKERLSKLFDSSEFKIICKPLIFSYNAENQKFTASILSCNSTIEFVERNYSMYLPYGIRLSFSVSPDEASKVKEQLDFIVYGYPVEYSEIGSYIKNLKFLPKKVRVVSRTTGKSYYEITIPNFLDTKLSTNTEEPTYSRPASTPPPKTPGTEVRVKGYFRKDGTYVRPHTRSKPRRKN